MNTLRYRELYKFLVDYTVRNNGIFPPPRAVVKAGLLPRKQQVTQAYGMLIRIGLVERGDDNMYRLVGGTYTPPPPNLWNGKDFK